MKFKWHISKKKIKEKIKKVYWKNLSNVVWEVLRLLKNVKKKKINYDNI